MLNLKIWDSNQNRVILKIVLGNRGLTVKSLANMEIAPDIHTTLVLFGRFFSNMAEDFISFFAILSSFYIPKA